MGFYIQTPDPLNKATQLIELYKAQLIKPPKDFVSSPSKVLICVVQNGSFDAAGICFDSTEFAAFNNPYDGRPKSWLLMDKDKVLELNPNTKKVLE